MKGQLQRVNIQRATLKDLEHGIKELEKRGYELIKKDVHEFENKDFRYADYKRSNKNRFDGWSRSVQYKAVMERVYYG